MNSPSEEHRAEAPNSIRCAIVTVSDTRDASTDRGGPLIVEKLESNLHQVVERQIVTDDPEAISALLDGLIHRDDVDAILMTGGTGVSRRDQTYETVTAKFDRQLPGYGELFRMLSYEQIGAAAILSRATGGVIGNKIVLTMPGSPKAVELAMSRVILPELGHLVREATK